jgi:serine/threonine protein kinase
MPVINETSDEPGPRYKRLVKYYLPEAELTQMFDLLMKIFRWHPQDRTTIDQIADHEWFGDRSKQKQAATGTTSTNINTSANTDTNTSTGTNTNTSANTEIDTDTDADTESGTRTSTSAKRAHPANPQPPAKRPKGGVESSGEEQTVRGSELIKTAWEFWAFCRRQVTLGLCRSTRRLVRLLLWGLSEIGRTASLVVGGIRGVRGRARGG